MDEERKPSPVGSAVNESIRPGFLGGSGSRESASPSAAEDLGTIEKAASNGDLLEKKDNGLDEAKETEKSGGFFTGSGKSDDKSKKKKGKFKGGFKKGGPIIAIMTAIFGFCGFMGGAQSLMPFAIQEMIIEKFNSIGISSTMASDSWLDTQLNQGVRLENLKTGETENLFAFSQFQVSAFSKQGIITVSNIGGETTQITALLYKKGNMYIPVVGSDFIGRQNLVEAIKAASGFENIGEPISAKEALLDQDFKVPYTAASKSWRGGSSGWFDEIMGKVTEIKLSINRNRWSRYANASLKSARKAFQEIANDAEKISKAGDGGIDEGVWKDSNDAVIECGECTVENGKLMKPDPNDSNNKIEYTGAKFEAVNSGDGTDLPKVASWANQVSKSEAFKKLSGILNSKAMKVASAGVSAFCGLMEGVTSIYTVVSAYQSLQFLNLVSGFLEAVSKVKSGSGDNGPVHEYSNNLTTVAETTDSGSVNESGEASVVANKTAMESQGIASLFSGGSINSSDASVQNVNFESLMSRLSIIASSANLAVETFEYCGYAKVTTGVVGLATSVVSFIPILGQGAKAATYIVKALKKVALSAAAQVALSILIPIATQKVVGLIIKNAATEWFGEDLGNALYFGANKYLGGNASSGGQGPGSREKVLSYLNEKNVVIAEEAKYQRSIRSPFDISSPYTLLGSLVYSVMPLVSSSSFGSISKNLSTLTSNSLVSLLPTASAVEISDELMPEGTCPILESSGAVGDAFCNPYVITDTTTINYSPVAISNIVHNLGSSTVAATGDIYSKIDSDNFENGKVKEGSNLAKYITYCGQRVSPYGLKDASIMGMSQDGNTVKTVAGFVPVVGDIMQLIDGGIDLANMKWTTGQQCVVSNDEDWETEYKYYQRYAENERLLESMNPGYKSTVTAYVEDYYRENPIDDSFEGTLARFSGMPKEQVEDTLAFIDYYMFIEQYQPENRYAFGEPAVKDDGKMDFSNGNKIAEMPFILLNEISFADVRNRSFAV